MSESIQDTQELEIATQELMSAISRRINLEDLNTTLHFEEPHVERIGGYDYRYSFSVSQGENPASKPNIVLFHGVNSIWHSRQIYKIDTETGLYSKTVVDVEPGLYETTEPDEYLRHKGPATAFDLGRLAGILDLLTLREAHQQNIMSATSVSTLPVFHNPETGFKSWRGKTPLLG